MRKPRCFYHYSQTVIKLLQHRPELLFFFFVKFKQAGHVVLLFVKLSEKLWNIDEQSFYRSCRYTTRGSVARRFMKVLWLWTRWVGTRIVKVYALGALFSQWLTITFRGFCLECSLWWPLYYTVGSCNSWEIRKCLATLYSDGGSFVYCIIIGRYQFPTKLLIPNSENYNNSNFRSLIRLDIRSCFHVGY